MADLIINLEDIESKQYQLVGGKAKNLAILIQAGFDVPPGFCVTTEIYNQFLKQHSIDKKVGQSFISQKIKDIQRQILVKKFPHQIAEEIVKRSKNLSEPLVVRSSASFEDLPDASFAGQYNTYLGVGRKKLPDLVKKCWASLWTERAISYRESNKIDHKRVLMGVIIQEMIISDVTGVLFTINPLDQNKDELVIEAVWGFGELLVSGKVTPDRFSASKKELKVIKKEKGSQREMMVYHNGNMSYKSVPWYKKMRSSLTNDQIINLCDLGIKIEDLFSFPQDIEWTIAHGNTYILQSRPITTCDKLYL